MEWRFARFLFCHCCDGNQSGLYHGCCYNDEEGLDEERDGEGASFSGTSVTAEEGDSCDAYYKEGNGDEGAEPAHWLARGLARGT